MKGYNRVLHTIFFISLFCESFLGQLFIFIFVPFTTKIILGLQEQTDAVINLLNKALTSALFRNLRKLQRKACAQERTLINPV